MQGGTASRWLAAGLLFAIATPAAAEGDIYQHQIRRVNAIVFDAAKTSEFLVATAYGLLAVAPDGLIRRVSTSAGGLSELVRDPKSPRTLYASGYRSKVEKLGVIRSDDGGKTWSHLAEGAGGPVAFHAMAISAADPATIYGVERDLQVSRDAGRTWSRVGVLPDQAIDLAAAAADPKRLYAATRQGLFGSADGGRTWTEAHADRRPAAMVQVTAAGRVYAFILGLGLITAEAGASEWKLVSDRFAGRALVHLAVDPSDSKRMLAVANTGAVMISRDGGKRWGSFEGQLDATPTRITAGKKLYDENCQACHGERGVGERPQDLYARDENGLPLAPPLDDSAHGWHHGDDQLRRTILDGSPRNPRMAAWKQHDISPDDARSLVAYIKSLWNFRSLACQGSRHMGCMR
jgi:photosystem II stability/assembly factor-like uncharacterized protein